MEKEDVTIDEVVKEGEIKNLWKRLRWKFLCRLAKGLSSSVFVGDRGVAIFIGDGEITARAQEVNRQSCLCSFIVKFFPIREEEPKEAVFEGR